MGQRSNQRKMRTESRPTKQRSAQGGSIPGNGKNVIEKEKMGWKGIKK